MRRSFSTWACSCCWARRLRRATRGGDTDFMTVVGETRVGPEDLSVTYEKLLKALAG